MRGGANNGDRGRCAARALFSFFAFVLAAAPAWGQSEVQPVSDYSFEESRVFEDEPDLKAAAARPPSLELSLEAPAAAVTLSAPGPDELARMQPQAGPTRVGIHRSLPEGTVAPKSSGGVAGTTVEGAWQTTMVGRLWRLRVTSTGARALRIHFQDFEVGKGSVWLHAADGQIDGPYSGRGMYGDGDFWSGIVFGDNAIIEYLPDPTALWKEDAPFRIAAISHIWVGPELMGAAGSPQTPVVVAQSQAESPAEKLVSAGARNLSSERPSPSIARCHLDVSCFSEWLSTARSVAHIVFQGDGGGAYLCSGVLINDRQSTGTPYFLTAAHCIDTDTEARSMVAYWHYQTQTCNGNAPSRNSRTVPITQGARLLVTRNGGVSAAGIRTDRGQDWSLLLLASLPPNYLLSGWDPRDYSGGRAITAIHHPGGSHKRIAFGNILGGIGSYYEHTRWQQGLTEPGSSGSPIFLNSSKRLTGVLSWGRGANEVPCQDTPTAGYNTFQDIYPVIRPFLESEVSVAALEPIARVAGNRRSGYDGDGGSATQARLANPKGLAVAGNSLYIADDDNNVIRRVSLSTGRIATVAGTGTHGFNGDGTATRARLYSPWGVDVAGSYLYIADRDNDRIRRVNLSTNRITTVAGNGSDSAGGDGGDATQAGLFRPQDVAVAGDYLYIAQAYAHRIRRVNLRTGRIFTVAGTGRAGYSGDGGQATQARLYYPWSVAVGGRYLYIADRYNNRIRRVNLSTRRITTVAGTGSRSYSGDGGPATEAHLNRPRGVDVDGSGNIYIADTENHRIRTVDAQGRITTVAGTGTAGYSTGVGAVARLSSPQAVEVSGNYLYISDMGNQVVRRLQIEAPQPPRVGGQLTSGQAARFRLGPVGSRTLFNGDHSYRLQVPANASRVTLTLDSDDNSVDTDLYVRRGQDVSTTGSADYRSTSGSGDEEIVIDRSSSPPLQAGTYYVSLRLYDTGVVAEGTLTATVELEQTPPPDTPDISSNGIVLATGTPAGNRISPNALISVFGEDFAPQGTQTSSPALDSAGNIAAKLADTCLEIGGQRAPLFAVFPTQINAQAPHGLTLGRARVEVVRGCGTPAEQRGGALVDTAAVSPAFFNFRSNANGRNPIVALHGGGPELAGAPGLIPGVVFTPAETGEYVTLFGTGFGTTQPPLAAGQIPGGQAPLANAVSFTFGGIAVPPRDIFYAGATPCCAGLYQFTVRVPRGLPDGDASVIAAVRGVSTPAGPFLTVRRR